MNDPFTELDTKEIEFADTVFVRDIETRVFQAIVVKTVTEIKDVALLEGNLLDNLLGREGNERVKGIYVEQDRKNHSISIKVEVNVAYGVSIPKKSEEIQTKIAAEICELTGLHVACVHVIFKALIAENPIEPDEPAQIEKEEIEKSEFSTEAFS